MKTLLTPSEVDGILRYRSGHAKRLARQGRIPCVCLPDGEIRFDEAEVEGMLASGQKVGKGAVDDR